MDAIEDLSFNKVDDEFMKYKVFKISQTEKLLFRLVIQIFF